MGTACPVLSAVGSGRWHEHETVEGSMDCNDHKAETVTVTAMKIQGHGMKNRIADKIYVQVLCKT